MRRSVCFVCFFLSLILLLVSCAPVPVSPGADASPSLSTSPTPIPQTEAPVTAAPSATAEPLSELERKLQQMSVEEKVGQLFFLRPEALSPSDGAVTELNDAMRQNIRKYHVGGVILFGKNIKTPEQTKQLTTQLRNADEIGLLLGIDEEGGLVARIGNNAAFSVPVYPAMGILSKEGESAVHDASFRIGTYLKSYGFHINFAPVADVNTNPRNPVIGTRAFSADPHQAMGLVRAAVKGFHEGGVLCTVKHFPGHGDTAEDSHSGAAAANKTLAEMEQCEFLPFQAGIAEGVDLVMMGHITTVKITGDHIPASLSPKIVTDVLREKLGYNGVIITDALEMEAITREYSSGEAAVLAVSAGVDVILCPEDFVAAYQGVLEAVQTGRVSESRLNESVRRILTLKQKAELI